MHIFLHLMFTLARARLFRNSLCCKEISYFLDNPNEFSLKSGSLTPKSSEIYYMLRISKQACARLVKYSVVLG
jgi:hypothetical protein